MDTTATALGLGRERLVKRAASAESEQLQLIGRKSSPPRWRGTVAGSLFSSPA
jgi:hypothetical protein